MKKPNFARFARDDSGAILVYTAATMTVFLGMAGVAMDLGYWYWSQRDLQTAADSAAMTAALEMARGATAAEIEARAKDSAGLNGYQDGVGSTLVTINRPPSTGIHNADNSYIEAIVQQEQGGFVSSVLHPGSMTIAARAVATLAGAPSCVIALDPGADGALKVSGNTTATLDCGAQANSTSPSAAAQQGGNSSLEAQSIQVTGGYSGSNFTPTPDTGMTPVEDPFAYLAPPAIGPCDEPSGAPKVYPSSYTGTVPAGVYCGGLEIQGADVEFEAGLYILDEVGLQMTGNGTMTNELGGVTFYFPPTVTGSGGNIAYIAGTTTVNLSAPTQDPYDGILFYVDPGADPTLQLALKGGTDMALTGVIYAPENHIEYAGNSLGNNTWTSIIANTIQFTGTSYLATTGFIGTNLPLALTVPSLAE
jgi:Flp pilus assembly protein TadG